MNRRDFFAKTTIGVTGASLLLPSWSDTMSPFNGLGKGKKPKNIIFMVSDGMSTGTLNMADIFLQMKEGRSSYWLDLYKKNKAYRGLMDMASASSVVTDSAAASSSWGGGVRVKNGHLNSGPNGEEYMPILQKFKKAGKKVGCVTTVPITHATPAGFCITAKTRNDQADIAEKYLPLKFDVMMGGGEKYFVNRKDGRNMYEEFRNAGYKVVNNKTDMSSCDNARPLLGVFDQDGLPYDLDRINDAQAKATIPSIAEMTSKAIALMKDHKRGFVLQVEGGKVDWAAHSNDAPALIYDQIAFDHAVKVAVDFAEKDGNTLVVITADHGNSNPGLYYGDKANSNFEKLFHYTHTNNWVLLGFKKDDPIHQLADRIQAHQGYVLPDDKIKFIFDKYKEQSDEGLYNEYKLPFKEYAQFQRDYTSVAFGGMEHTADYVELTMFGPGSERLKPFMRNVEMHTFLLEVAEVENKF
jgi:alkaline phosphatase